MKNADENEDTDNKDENVDNNEHDDDDDIEENSIKNINITNYVVFEKL